MSDAMTTGTKLSGAALLAELDRVRAERDTALAQAKAAAAPTKRERVGLTFRVGEKGGVSVYGLGRFPVTLYAEQWEALLARSADILDYITANEGRLSRKA